VIISAFKHALKDALEIIEEISLPVDIDDDKAMYSLISSSIGTKFVSRWSELMCSLALKAVRTVTHEIGNGKKEVDIKRYAKVEKVPGGEIEDSRVLDGVMLNKDITHPKMRRRSCAVGLHSGVQEGRITNKHRDQQGGRLESHSAD
jgi:T-complex protein 1 subunit gamma